LHLNIIFCEKKCERNREREKEKEGKGDKIIKKLFVM
jgi:hypothetical protein